MKRKYRVEFITWTIEAEDEAKAETAALLRIEQGIIPEIFEVSAVDEREPTEDELEEIAKDPDNHPASDKELEDVANVE